MAGYRWIKFLRGGTDWQDEAACYGADLNNFYNSSNSAEKGRDNEKYLPGRYLYCLPSSYNDDTECPVRQECLEYALRNREDHGIWGGYTTTERRRIARERRTVHNIEVPLDA